MTDELALDYETRSEVDLKVHGLDRYSADRSTRVLMGAYSFNNGRIEQWIGPRPPREVEEALADPHVQKWAFNAQFERVITRRVLGIKTPIRNWRCTQVLAYMQSFVGTLEQVGRQVGLPEDKQKLNTGKKLISMFTKPQRVTKKQPLRWLDDFTNPDEWEEFCEYNVQDVVAESGIKRRLIKYPIGPGEWELYELDQLINDRGLPIDTQFVENAIRMVAIRKAELRRQMEEVTGLANPLSGPQLLPWLRDRGYPFSDLQKDTIKKVLTENKQDEILEEEAVKALKLRQQAVRTSTAKYNALHRAVGANDRFRFGFQFNGASRTGRWAGRRLNPQNLTRTPKEIEPDEKKMAEVGLPADYHLENVTNIVRDGDYELLKLYVEEPMNALAGTVRSAIRAPEEYELRPGDLSAIETCVIAWIANCKRMLEVVASGMDPYKDFGTELYSKAYDEITKTERTNSKPAVLGAGYRLGGGELKDGKRTGLWGYAESMGINLTQDESERAVKLFRATYPEYPKLWYALEDAVKIAVTTGRKSVPTIRMEGRPPFKVPVTFEMKHPYLLIWLPSGRPLYYHKPRIREVEMQGRNGPYKKPQFSYLGQPQGTKKWVRMDSHGGKITENIVQAIARDVLVVGMKRAHKDGFNIVGHVHDELITLIRRGDNYYTVERLCEIMAQDIPWAPGLPLGAAGWAGAFYRKD